MKKIILSIFKLISHFFMLLGIIALIAFVYISNTYNIQVAKPDIIYEYVEKDPEEIISIEGEGYSSFSKSILYDYFNEMYSPTAMFGSIIYPYLINYSSTEDYVFFIYPEADDCRSEVEKHSYTCSSIDIFKRKEEWNEFEFVNSFKNLTISARQEIDDIVFFDYDLNGHLDMGFKNKSSLNNVSKIWLGSFDKGNFNIITDTDIAFSGEGENYDFFDPPEYTFELIRLENTAPSANISSILISKSGEEVFSLEFEDNPYLWFAPDIIDIKDNEYILFLIRSASFGCSNSGSELEACLEVSKNIYSGYEKYGGLWLYNIGNSTLERVIHPLNFNNENTQVTIHDVEVVDNSFKVYLTEENTLTGQKENSIYLFDSNFKQI